MERDPVCGMFIDLADALWLEYHGKTYYFCSQFCRREFEDRPDEYAEHHSAMALDGVVLDPIMIMANAVQEGKGPIGR